VNLLLRPAGWFSSSPPKVQPSVIRDDAEDIVPIIVAISERRRRWLFKEL
jgi:hypothetical protein